MCDQSFKIRTCVRVVCLHNHRNEFWSLAKRRPYEIRVCQFVCPSFEKHFFRFHFVVGVAFFSMNLDDQESFKLTRSDHLGIFWFFIHWGTKALSVAWPKKAQKLKFLRLFFLVRTLCQAEFLFVSYISEFSHPIKFGVFLLARLLWFFHVIDVIDSCG